MNLSGTINGERFTFADLRDVFAKANEEKAGDQLAMIAARNRARAHCSQVCSGRSDPPGDCGASAHRSYGGRSQPAHP